MAFSDDEIQEFNSEARELLECAENALLKIDQGGQFQTGYAEIFRAFHSIKGAAGMMEMPGLQAHMHQLENILTGLKDAKVLEKSYADFFLRGIDAAVQFLEGKVPAFEYVVDSRVATPEPAPAQPKPAAIASPISKSVAKAGRAFVIDDEVEIIEYLSEVLTDAGFQVASSDKPVLAIDEIKRFQPDVVLTDLSMPELSGMQVLEALRRDLPDLPVVFVSGHVDKEVLLKSIALGIFGVIEKPFSEVDVIQLAQAGAHKHQLVKLLSKSLNLLLYQFPDLDQFLEAQGKDEIRKILKQEIEALLEGRKRLRNFSKKAA